MVAAVLEIRPDKATKPKIGGDDARLRQKQKLRETIRAEADHVIATRGLAALKARQLAQAAGCALGALYLAFQDLDEIVLEVNAVTLRGIDAACAQASAARPDQRVMAIAEAYLTYAARNRLRWEALFAHQMEAPPSWYARLLDSVLSQFDAPLQEMRPHMEARENEQLARMIFAAVHGMVALGLHETAGPPAAMHGQIRTVVAAILDGLRGWPPEVPW
jgi:AcrR family transcriptional regulator